MTHATTIERGRSWLFIAAAAIPCVAALLFCAVGIQEWWLISTEQIAVIPAPKPGVSTAREVPASSLLPFIFGSGALAATFGYALLRNSRRVLVAGYVAVGLIAALGWASRALASQEGAGVAEAIVLMLFVGLGAVVASALGGAAYGGYKAAQKNESIARGIGFGILKGLGASLVVGVVLWVALTVLGALFVGYALLTSP